MACFDGEISKESVTPIDAWLSRVSPGTHPLLLVRSRGGDAEAGIGIMEDLQAADAEVRVVDFCASSCADYFFAGAKHRSVTDGAVILFHGGYSPEARGHLLETLEIFKESGKAPGTDWAKARTSALADFDRVMALQDELYARVGVSNEIVRGMDKLDIDSLRESDCDSTRSAERKAVFFTPAQLQRMGIRIEQGKEAAEPREVQSKAQGDGLFVRGMSRSGLLFPLERTREGLTRSLTRPAAAFSRPQASAAPLAASRTRGPRSGGCARG